jgi:hypothetical protein
MKDVVLPLRTGYVSLLNNMTVDGKQIPVFDMVAPVRATPPYVIIDSIMYVNDNTKDTFGGEVTVDFLVHARYDGDFGGREETDKIANKLYEIAIPSPGKAAVTAEGFDVTMAKNLGASDEMDYLATGRKYRKRISLEHTVWERKP